MCYQFKITFGTVLRVDLTHPMRSSSPVDLPVRLPVHSLGCTCTLNIFKSLDFLPMTMTDFCLSSSAEHIRHDEGRTDGDAPLISISSRVAEYRPARPDCRDAAAAAAASPLPPLQRP